MFLLTAISRKVKMQNSQDKFIGFRNLFVRSKIPKPKAKRKKNTKHKPWKYQKKLQKEYSLTDLPTVEELYSTCMRCEDEGKRALFALLYLTAARISEILPISNKDNGGIKKKNISFDYIDNKPVGYVRLRNMKNKTRKSKRLPIPIEKEKQLYKLVYDHIKYLPDEAKLFTFGRRTGYNYCTKVFGLNPHFIRHIRASHLVLNYDFNEQALVRFMGWSDPRPAKYYIEMNDKSVFRQFYK